MKPFVFLLLMLPPTEALAGYDPQLCYILDGFLGLYGLVITGMFIREKFFKSKAKWEDGDMDPDAAGDGYSGLLRDSERGRNRWLNEDSTYTDLNRRTDGEYKELPVKRERQKKNEVYQDLSSATRDTYDSLQMQPLPAR
nr:T-cell receptor complex zeta chain [Paralichthys olivaceus]